MIEFTHVHHTYSMGEQLVHALNDLTFSIAAGELVAIIGPSGSGKTTLMNLLGLLDCPTDGHYHLDGQNIENLNENQLAVIRNQSIGFIFQSFFLLPRLTALDNVCQPLLYRGFSLQQARPLARERLEQVGMSNRIMHKPQALSGGQQQRVAIARALVGDPKIILADEPTGSLDSKIGHDIMELFLDLNRRAGKTTILITHDPNIAAQCPRILQLHDGKLIRDQRE